MNFLRNTFAVLLGLAVSAAIITVGVRINPKWITYTEISPFEHWDKFLSSLQSNRYFFLMLLFASGVGATIGGVITALIVKYAKVAYAMLIGFMLLFIALLDIIIFPYHPTFYKIGIFFTFFPFAWFGGKIVEVIYERRKKMQQRMKQKRQNKRK